MGATFFFKKWVQTQLFYFCDPNLIECLNIVDVQATIGQETLREAQLLEKRGVDALEKILQTEMWLGNNSAKKTRSLSQGYLVLPFISRPCEMTWETFRHRGTYTRLGDPRVAGWNYQMSKWWHTGEKQAKPMKGTKFVYTPTLLDVSF